MTVNMHVGRIDILEILMKCLINFDLLGTLVSVTMVVITQYISSLGIY